ncbi:hypothetical protein, partial [Mycolicibacterium poriferae]|uniref:hypothetical protein n=1 Tax=Mycolicibacterium poriferae TaxID=39694 RepID=UPI0024B95D4A
MRIPARGHCTSGTGRAVTGGERASTAGNRGVSPFRRARSRKFRAGVLQFVVRLQKRCNTATMAASDTHVVTNQVPPLENYNPATSPVLA